jgi:CPA2 family monovalent cation:H+ antiporter-2
MHEVTLLLNIVVALVAAFFGGLLVRRLGLPTIVGYLLAGIVIGPFTPGFVGDLETIRRLAELGVIFLMFGVGLHFSFGDLWRRQAEARNQSRRVRTERWIVPFSSAARTATRVVPDRR